MLINVILNIKDKIIPDTSFFVRPEKHKFFNGRRTFAGNISDIGRLLRRRAIFYFADTNQ